MGGMLTRKQINEAKDGAGEVHTMTVEEWGGDIGLKHMTAGERDAYELSNLDSDALEDGTVTQRRENFRARLLAHCMCDADGILVYADKKGKITDKAVAELAAKGAAIVQKVHAKAAEINGLSEAAVKEEEGN
jgi:hypothetical protein